jgi:hypothetical protein
MVRKSIGVAVLVTIACGLTSVLPRQTPVDNLVLRSKTADELRELTVDLHSGGARLFIWDLTAVDRPCGARSGGPVNQQLRASELRELVDAAGKADLFGGQTTGGEIRSAFRVIEAHASSEIAVLVVSLNDSFVRPGARANLFNSLDRIERRMTPRGAGLRRFD